MPTDIALVARPHTTADLLSRLARPPGRAQPRRCLQPQQTPPLPHPRCSFAVPGSNRTRTSPLRQDKPLCSAKISATLQRGGIGGRLGCGAEPSPIDGPSPTNGPAAPRRPSTSAEAPGRSAVVTPSKGRFVPLPQDHSRPTHVTCDLPGTRTQAAAWPSPKLLLCGSAAGTMPDRPPATPTPTWGVERWTTHAPLSTRNSRISATRLSRWARS